MKELLKQIVLKIQEQDKQIKAIADTLAKQQDLIKLMYEISQNK